MLFIMAIFSLAGLGAGYWLGYYHGYDAGRDSVECTACGAMSLDGRCPICSYPTK